MTDGQQDPYRAAYNEAASELQKIFGEVERLRIRQEHVARLVDVLNRKFGFQAELAGNQLRWKSEAPGLSVITSLSAVQMRSEDN